MSKELDYLDKILNYQPLTLVERTIIECIKEKIQRLEAIDNANPSEALEYLEYIENKLRGLRVECERIKNHRCDDVFIQEHTFDTIKQALLKAQEPKQYLKWEDLEFKKEGQIIKVILNGSKYKVAYFTDGITEYVDLLTDGEKLKIIGRYVDAESHEKQFFNDLHLERVEE